MPHPSEQLRRSWTANAGAWRDAVREHRIASRAVTDAAIVAAVLEATPRRVLDVGCGEGWLARALSAHGVDVTGIDASEPLIEAANALGGATFRVMSYEDLNLEGTFDAIVANFSFLDDRPPLGALKNVLDGVLIVQTIHPAFVDGPYVDGWRTETFKGLPGDWSESMLWYFRTIGSWLRLFAESGYVLTEVREPLYPDRPVPASIVFVLRGA
jgi:SAM-dependent methyltransferase